MTEEQWLALKVGDRIVDRHAGGRIREVLELSRVSGKRGQRRGGTRTTITVTNLKSPQLTTIIYSTADIRGERFELAPPGTPLTHEALRCQARSPGGSTEDGQLPRKGTQCGLFAGHEGEHTIMIPSEAPWFKHGTYWRGA